jgi:hypothetical protein
VFLNSILRTLITVDSCHIYINLPDMVVSLFSFASFTVNEQGQSVSFPAASAFFQFPAEAVANKISIWLSCIRHQDCKVKPRTGDVFCSSIVKMEPEGYVFNKPVTVLLSHCAAQDGAYADYYDLTIQKLDKECEDLETEQLDKPEGRTLE